MIDHTPINEWPEAESCQSVIIHQGQKLASCQQLPVGWPLPKITILVAQKKFLRSSN